MELFTEMIGDGAALQAVDAYFDPALASNFQVDREEGVVTFDYDIGECGNSLNLPFTNKIKSLQFMVKVTPFDLHVCVLTEYNIAGTPLKKFADNMGNIEFNVRLGNGLDCDRNEEKLMMCYIINSLLGNK